MGGSSGPSHGSNLVTNLSGYTKRDKVLRCHDNKLPVGDNKYKIHEYPGGLRLLILIPYQSVLIDNLLLCK